MKIRFPILGILLFGSLAVLGNPNRGVIGNDDRIEVNFDHFETPGSQYLGLLEVNGVLGCSAVMVGPKHIATVPHCFEPWLADVKANPGLVKFHLHYSRGNETAVSTVTSLEIWSGYAGYSNQTDWAVLTIDKPLGEIFGWVEPIPTTPDKPVTLYSYGYPSSKKSLFGYVPVYHQACAAAEVNGKTRQGGIGFIDCDITPGNSGGPTLAEIPNSPHKKQFWLYGLNVRTGLTTDYNEVTLGSHFYDQWLASVLRIQVLETMGLVEKLVPVFAQKPEEAKPIIAQIQAFRTTVERTDASSFLGQDGMPLVLKLYRSMRERFTVDELPHQANLVLVDNYMPLTVKSVIKDGYADRAGFVPGDQIVKMQTEDKRLGGPFINRDFFLMGLNAANGKLDYELYHPATRQTRTVRLSTTAMTEEEKKKISAERAAEISQIFVELNRKHPQIRVPNLQSP